MRALSHQKAGNISRPLLFTLLYSIFFENNNSLYLFTLFSKKPNKYYIGFTADVVERLAKHNRSAKGFTSLGKPWELVYQEGFPGKSEAMGREKQLKRWKNKNLISKLQQQAGLEHPGTIGRVAGSNREAERRVHEPPVAVNNPAVPTNE